MASNDQIESSTKQVSDIINSHCSFLVLLNELASHVERYLASDRMKTIEEESCKLMEEAYNAWEKTYLDSTTAESVASEIAYSAPNVLEIIHDFMSRALSGQFYLYLREGGGAVRSVSFSQLQGHDNDKSHLATRHARETELYSRNTTTITL